MSGRLIAIAIAVAVWAVAGIRDDAQARPELRQSHVASGQLMEPPGPESGVPANLTAGVSTSATVPTVLVVESRHLVNPVRGVPTVPRHRSVVAQSAGKPRFFPLLI